MRMAPFDEVLVDITSRSPKLNTAGYNEHGRFPVIDQGASHTAGRTDDESLVTRADRPLILFGDHTRRFKLIDEDFVVGADGLKVLAVGTEHDARYVFHALRSISLPDAGYSRHFKYLRRARLPVVPRQQQQRIAALLDQVDELRAKRRRTLALLEDLGAARLQQFLERSECSEVPFGSFISDLRYGSSTKAADHGSLVMRIPNVQRGALWLDEMKRVPLSTDETGTFALQEGDLLMVRSNGSPDLIGRAAAFTSARIAGTPLASESVVFASYLLRVRLSARALPAYVEAVLASSPLRRSIRAIARTSAGQYNLNGPAVRNLSIPLPPLADQQQVVAGLEAISAVEADHRTHLAKLDELFASLQHRAFTGRL